MIVGSGCINVLESGRHIIMLQSEVNARHGCLFWKDEHPSDNPAHKERTIDSGGKGRRGVASCLKQLVQLIIN